MGACKNQAGVALTEESAAEAATLKKIPKKTNLNKTNVNQLPSIAFPAIATTARGVGWGGRARWRRCQSCKIAKRPLGGGGKRTRRGAGVGRGTRRAHVQLQLQLRLRHTTKREVKKLWESIWIGPVGGCQRGRRRAAGESEECRSKR